MSALRISRPGYETVFIDLGPGQAHTGRIGGSMIEGNANAKAIMPSTTAARRAQMTDYRAKRKAA